LATQSPRQPLDVLKRYVPEAALNVTDVRAMKPGAESQLFLRDTKDRAARPHSRSESYLDVPKR
jgi:hypothetical protein